MLVLGRKYKFTPFELKRLEQRFPDIHIVPYQNRNQEDVLEELTTHLQNKDCTLLVLNTNVKVGDDIIRYLTNLQFEKRSKRLRVITIEHFLEEYLHKCYIPQDHNDLHFLTDIKAYNLWQYFQKRCIDYFGLFWLFFFSWPVMLWCRKKIRQESPGSYLFLQDRVGFKNGLFKCCKFRTMHENSYHNPYTQENDNRIFPFGNLMRKARFDELPQMWNILKGEMHLIGPRAEWNILVEEYEKSLPYYNERHLVRPGITGWAQVNYPYGQNIEDTRQKLMYDLYYIKHWNIGLELKIVWMTALTVIHKKGL